MNIRSNQTIIIIIIIIVIVMVIILRTRSDCQYTRNNNNNNIIYRTTGARDVSGRKTCAWTNDRKVWAHYRRWPLCNYNNIIMSTGAITQMSRLRTTRILLLSLLSWMRDGNRRKAKVPSKVRELFSETDWQPNKSKYISYTSYR